MQELVMQYIEHPLPSLLFRWKQNPNISMIQIEGDTSEGGYWTAGFCKEVEKWKGQTCYRPLSLKRAQTRFMECDNGCGSSVTMPGFWDFDFWAFFPVLYEDFTCALSLSERKKIQVSIHCPVSILVLLEDVEDSEAQHDMHQMRTDFLQCEGNFIVFSCKRSLVCSSTKNSIA